MVATDKGSPDDCGDEGASRSTSSSDDAPRQSASSENPSSENPSSENPSSENPSSSAALPFDAVANLRLLGEVQRRGLEAANAVIARLTERTNAAGSAQASSGPQDQMATMADAFIESVVAATAAMVPGIDPVAGPFASDADRGPSGHPDAPEVLSGRARAGEAVEVALWVHNYTDDTVTDVEVHLTELIAAGGARLAHSCVTVHPERPFELSPASSRQVSLTIEVPADASPGRYRAIVTAAHLADLWLVLVVDVGTLGDGSGDGSTGDGSTGDGSTGDGSTVEPGRVDGTSDSSKRGTADVTRDPVP